MAYAKHVAQLPKAVEPDVKEVDGLKLWLSTRSESSAKGRPRQGSTPSFELRTSRIEVRGLLAFGGPPRRLGWTQLAKMVRLDPRRCLGIRFERILTKGELAMGNEAPFRPRRA